MKNCLCLLALLTLPLGLASAQDITATGSQPGGAHWNQASWTGGQWSDGLAPSAGNTYSTGTFGIRTVDGASSTFNGDSLRVVDGGTLLLKQNYGNTATIGTLILDGGTLASGNGTTGGDQQLVSGNLHVASDSFIGLGDTNRRRITFQNGNFTGSGTLTIQGGNDVNDLFYLTSSMITAFFFGGWEALMKGGAEILIDKSPPFWCDRGG